MEILGVGVGIDDDLALARGQAAPHRIALAASRPELGEQLALLLDARACSSGDLGRTVLRAGVDDDRLVEQPGVFEACCGLDDRPDRRGDFARRQHQPDARALDGEQIVERELARRHRCAAHASLPARDPCARPRGARPLGARGRSHTHAAAAVDRDALARRVRSSSASSSRAARTGSPPQRAYAVAVKRQRGAAELVMLDQLGRNGSTQRALGPLPRGMLACTHRFGREGRELVLVQFDAAADRLGTRAEELELNGEPIRRDDAVGVGAGDQPISAAEAAADARMRDPCPAAVSGPTPARSRERHLVHTQFRSSERRLLGERPPCRRCSRRGPGSPRTRPRRRRAGRASAATHAAILSCSSRAGMTTAARSEGSGAASRSSRSARSAITVAQPPGGSAPGPVHSPRRDRGSARRRARPSACTRR